MKLEEVLKGSPDNIGLLLTDSNYNIMFSGGMAEEFLDPKYMCPEMIVALKSAVEKGFSVYKLEELGRSVMIDTGQMMYGDTLLHIFWLRDWSANADTEVKLQCATEILDNINEGVIATDRNGYIFIYNKQLAEFEDLPQKSVIGKRLMDVYEWSRESSEHMQVLESMLPIAEGNYRTITRSGKTNQLIASTHPVMKEGNAVAAYSISRNVTKIRDMYNRTVDLLPVNSRTHRHLKNGTRFTFEDIIHESQEMKSLILQAQKAALGPSPVLVYGETGTGKELLIQGIHNGGPAREEPFIALNCAALPESLLESLLFGTVKGAFTGAETTVGFFEQAKGGTLYLDEINSMPLNLQAKLLRAIQERQFRRIGGTSEITMKCKIVSSVNKDPLTCVKDGQLRQDLYYRLGVITLYIPPLRNRREDIPKLIQYFLTKYCVLYGNKNITVSQELLELLKSYDWPGNVRELEHLFERTVSLTEESEELSIHNLPHYLRNKLYMRKFMGSEEAKLGSLSEILYEVEKKAIIHALEANHMNITRAAKSIGIGRQNMQYRIKKLGLKLDSME